jgi:hypothetical protein
MPTGCVPGNEGKVMEESMRRQMRNWRDVGLRGVILLPLVVGALLGITQALILLCVAAFLLLSL